MLQTFEIPEHFLWLEFNYGTYLSDIGKFPGSLVSNIQCKIFCEVIDLDLPKPKSHMLETGYMKLNLYNLELAANTKLSIMDAFYISEDTFEIGEVLIDKRSDDVKRKIRNQFGDTFNSNILVIHDFMIYPKYRKQRLGEEVLRGIMQHFEGSCGYVALKSLPKQFESEMKLGLSETGDIQLEVNELNDEYKKAQLKLNSFYKRCGFTKIKGYRNFFIKNIERF